MIPEEEEPTAGAMDRGYISTAMDQMRLAYRRTAEQMPLHADFIARTCPAH
jgi:tryptophan halogenase